MMNRESVRALGRIVCVTLAWSAAVPAADLPDITPIVDLRWRDEHVSQLGFADDANADTFRARLGFQTSKVDDTSLLAEGSFNFALDRRYRPDTSVPTYTQYPVVGDPENYAVNRLQLTNTSLPLTTLILGRQRINLDDQRFVGASNWRMSEQTLDAVRAIATPGAFTIDLTYSSKFHRTFGVDSPQGTYKGRMVLANVGYSLGSLGKLIGFAYLEDFDPLPLPVALNPLYSSNSTYGGRFIGSQPLGQAFKLGYIFSYATQRQRGDNPRQFSNDYFKGELSLTWQKFTLGAGDEIADGNGTVGFMTPLATLHPVNGWVNKFLTIPPNGLDDRYGNLVWNSGRMGWLDNLSLTGAFHHFQAERVMGSYGDEWDGMLTAKHQRYQLLLEWGDYRSGARTPISVARDTTKFWTELDYIW
jgi:hypothetical protein